MKQLYNISNATKHLKIATTAMIVDEDPEKNLNIYDLDCITIYHTLEHLSQPIKILQRLRK